MCKYIERYDTENIVKIFNILLLIESLWKMKKHLDVPFANIFTNFIKK